MKENQTLFKDTTDDEKMDFIFGYKDDNKGFRFKFDKDLENAQVGFNWKFADGGLAPLLGEPTYADGGRIGFKLGGIDKARRAFLKWLGVGTAGTMAAKSGLLSIFKGGGKKQIVESLTQIPIGSAPGMPPWFKLAVNKVIKEGDDVTKKFATKEREIVHQVSLEGKMSKEALGVHDVRVTQSLDDGTIRLEYNSPDTIGESGVELVYKKGEVIEPTISKTGKVTKGTKTKDEFTAVEDDFYPQQTSPDGDFDLEFTENIVKNVDDLYSDTSKLKEFATGKKLTKKEILEATKKKNILKEIEKNPNEHAFRNTPEYDGSYEDDVFASGGRVPLRGGGGLMNLFKMLFKKKPAKLESLKDFIERRQFLKNMVGNTPENEKARILANLKKIMEETRKNPGFKFPDVGPGSDIHKEIEMILSKDVTKHATGGRVPMFAGLLAKGGQQLGKFTKSDVLLQMFENTVKQTKSPNTKKRFTNFIKEIKAKPELANDPEVWGFFTKGLPKNQRLVVHSDDTVDFWRQSDFGPHNIKTTDKFMKKHPHLSRDEAVRIQNMEPEDQILEMKRLETIRKRTTNASGGIIDRVPYFKGGSWKAIKEAIKHNKIFGLGGPPYKPGATSFDIKQLTKDRFGTELSLQELKEMGIKEGSFSKFLKGLKEYKADVIKAQLMDSKQKAEIGIKVAKDILNKPLPEGLDPAIANKMYKQMIREDTQRLKDIEEALGEIDVYKAMKEKTGVTAHATGGRV